ncbi:nitrate- and nitrite sensing domain-containing protein [Actinomadura rugatobispora]|uniref:histidine kinase n=1 Tax=Actinomadura rugatobispora TaxID=1994 RepID=A0ABW1A9D4_9ACTN|nr:nitrate- and nitrite sensing domain-containing protein [Actinomadura rugatobispora]
MASRHHQERPPGKRPRRRPIRLRITALLLVPLLSLIGLWGFAASITLGDALDKYDFSDTYEKISLPGIYLVNQLQQERQLSVVALSTGGRAGGDGQERQRLEAQRKRADGVQASFRRTALSAEARDAADARSEQRLAAALKRLDTLPALRAQVDSGGAETLQIIDAYSLMLDSIIQVFSGLVIVNDLAIFEQGRALISLGNARAFMLREDALVTAALARDGRFTPAEHLAFVQSVALGRREWQAGMNDLDDELRAPLERLAASQGFKDVRAMEGAIAAAPGNRLPGEAANWPATTPRLSQAWEQAVTQTSLSLNEMAQPIGERIVLRLALAGGFGLLAVVASVILSLLAARSLSRELRGLQRAALNLAEDRLPGVVARLRRGEEVDVAAEAPPLEVGKTTEVARVGEAFNRVQRTAIETAVSESHLRKGISRVFLNVAWRSQSLLHRQLSMLDEMERGASDPKALEDLFRLDHLTTRMRRHAEGLVILSGASPGRGWSRPVHVDDVLRAAVAEVEDYTRVEVVVVSAQAAVIGEVVADIIHLLAELIENATVFSPPPTEVLVRGEMGANGFAIDIVDRGIGLEPAEMDALNMRLARPPEFDLADSDRLGLFVVSRLAARHGVKVALQPSLYGGISAVVLVPRELIVDVEGPEDDAPRRPERAPIARPQDPGRPPAIQAPGGRNGVPNPAQTIEAEVWRNPSPGPGNNAELSAPVPDRPVLPGPRPSPEASPGPVAGITDIPVAGATGAPAHDFPAPDVPVAGISDGSGSWTPESWTRPLPEPEDRHPYVPPPMSPPQVTGTGSGRTPLPRRVRQASLAPELRNVAPPQPPGATPPEGTRIPFAEDRSAEASRDLFASLQAGWLRGREEDEGPAGRAGFTGEGFPGDGFTGNGFTADGRPS